MPAKTKTTRKNKGTKRITKPKDPNAPKQIKNPYLAWLHLYKPKGDLTTFQQYRKDHPEVKAVQAISQLSPQWKLVDEVVKTEVTKLLDAHKKVLAEYDPPQEYKDKLAAYKAAKKAQKEAKKNGGAEDEPESE